MALNHSPSIVTNGLVFAYDMNNTQKSWKGAPTTNLISISNWNNNLTGWSSWFWVTGTRTMDSVNVLYQGVSVLEGLITGTAQGGPAYLDLGGLSTTLGTTYTVSVWFKSSSRSCYVYSHDTLGNGTVYGNTTVANGAWQKSTFIFTVVSTTGSMRIHLIANSGNINDTIYVTAPQVELGSLSTPFVNGTRSNAQAIVDLTGTNTVTATSLTYNSNNTFSFNGSSDMMTNSVAVSNQSSTNFIGRSWVATVKPSSSITAGGIFGHVLGSGCTYYCNGGLTVWDGKYAFCWYDNASYQFLDSGVTATVGQYVQIAGTYNPVDNKARIYVNGILKNTGASTNLNYGNFAYQYQIGYLSASTSKFAGTIDQLMWYYNKTLTDTEVLQNFNAHKGRYGL